MDDIPRHEASADAADDVSSRDVGANDELDYRRGIRAWVTYDWANSAFVTVIVTAVFPVYFSSVAGATLPSAARATQMFSLVTTIALVVTAIVSPPLGAWSDLVAAKKKLLAGLVAVGAVATGALWVVSEGDWLLGLVLFGIGRVAFSTGNVLYDALLPTVARPEDQDAVSARGYAFGYLGGGLLLAANVALVLLLDGTLGSRIAFLSVAVWWVVFSLPLLRHVPEPPPTGDGSVGLVDTFRQTVGMVRSLKSLPDLRQFLISYLIYNDGINVVISVAALYGAELGFGTVELLLAVLLVQFIGGPYAVLLGRLATPTAARRDLIAGFLLANIVLVPIVGIAMGLWGPGEVVGRAAAPYEASGDAVGQGEADLAAGPLAGADQVEVPGDLLGSNAPVPAAVVTDAATLDYIGRNVVITHDVGPDGGTMEVLVDGEVAVDPDGQPLRVDLYNDVVRYGQETTVVVDQAGRHTLTIRSDVPVTITSLVVAPPPRDSSLPLVLGILLVVQVVAALLGWALRRVVAPWAERVDAKHGIMFALVAYTIVAVWGFTLDTVVEFWALAWLVGVVQGGSQALSRSLYASLLPPRREGEYFGLFSILSKFASFISPLLFVVSVALFESSRPAVLSLAVLFLAGMALLVRVDVARGRRRRHAWEPANVADTNGPGGQSAGPAG